MNHLNNEAVEVRVKHLDSEEKKVEVKSICGHQCSGDCRREGCNCECGEYHAVDTVDELPSNENGDIQ